MYQAFSKCITHIISFNLYKSYEVGPITIPFLQLKNWGTR